MRNIKLTLAYDGTNYLGWQKTSMGPSVEGTLEKVLHQIFQHEIALQAASRTDAGVHANGQVVNFFVSKESIDFDKLLISINSLLPKDIVVLSIGEESPSFHPTINAQGKEYRYFICYGKYQLPQQRYYSWHYHYPLNLEDMKKGAEILAGEHNFLSFCNAKKNATYKNYNRTVSDITIREIESNRLCIHIRGDHFLYKMVRNLVGTLAYIGRGKIKLNELQAILNKQERAAAGVTAPAHGLFLHEVFYNAN